jgi:hypothetical protein
MDDGCKTGSSFRLNTSCYTLEEIELLIKVLKENFDLDSSIQFHNSKAQ